MIKKLFYYGKENNKTTILSIILLFFAALLLILPFLFIYQTIYAIVSEQKITTIFVLKEAMAILICLIIQAVLYVKGLSLSHKAAYGTIMNIRVSLQNKMEKLPLGIIESKGVGAFKKIFTDDIDSFEQLLAHAIPEGISNALGTLLVLLGIFSCDWRLGVLVLIIVPLGLIPVMLMYKIGNKGMANYYTASQIMNNTIIEYVNGMEVVKVFNKSGESYKKLKTAVNNYRDYTLKWYRSCWPFMAIYQSFLPYTLLFALPVGSILVMKGIVGVAPFILALCLALGLGAPLLRTISFMSVVPQIRYKIEELEKVLDSPPVKEGQNFYQGKSYDICFEHVFFRYDEKEVLHDINLNIKTNTKVALVGESGAGKSTLAKLLIHYYDVNNGKIMIGNQNICDMRLEALNELIAYVSQDNFLFNMSLMENIRIGKPTASDEEVVAAAKKAQCMDFINRLSEGIYTKAGDSGNKLSGGERQRITLARAILKDAPIIVLDEATAFTDSENEIKIESVLSELVKHKTLIVIAHRLTTIVNAQQICILDKGNLVDCGTHKELLEKCEIYRNLWKANQDSTQWQIGGNTE
ncbi:ABC transporter ATP-binding protein [Blautia wexlerae]